MGKSQPQLPLHHRQHPNHHGLSVFARCSICFSTIGRFFTFKCFLYSLVSFAVFVFPIFSALHHKQIGFDADDSIKNSATVQAYFTLEKPRWFLIPQITKLEDDITAEIGVPETQVAILSMHEAGASNSTLVVFGVLSYPRNSPINPVSLSVLKSSLVELFTQSSNLTLTTPIFGHPSFFGILKFPGGVTIIPKHFDSFWKPPQVLFNFTLNSSSLHGIEENSLDLKKQLESGLHLMPYESLYVQVTNEGGSTDDSPVGVQASVVSNIGSIVPQRLKQLAQTINGSVNATNLGLNDCVFGKVKEVRLSSYLSHTLDAPTPSPAPSPDQNNHLIPSPSMSPSPDLPPCSTCIVYSPSPDSGPDQPLTPLPHSPAPSMDPFCGSNASPGPSPISDPGSSPHAYTSPPPMDPSFVIPPDLSLSPAVSYGSGPTQDNGYNKGSAPPPLPVLYPSLFHIA